MRATAFEYRFRVLLHILIFLLGFWPFWEHWLGLTEKSTWLTMSAFLARQGWLGFQAATLVLLLVAIAFTALGAWFRVWGAAYVGPAVVQSPSMHANTLLADGPYRRTRNPLYLGTLLHTVGVALFMPPAGAVFAIVAIWLLQVRLALAEEPFLEVRFGQRYRDYMARVPRFLPAAQVAPSGVRPHWAKALAGEIYFLGVVITLLCFGWNFNATPLMQGILVSLGVAIVLQALLPKVVPSAPSIGA